MRASRVTVLRLAAALALAGSVAWSLAAAGLFEVGRVSRGLRNVGIFVGDMVPPDTERELVSVLLASLGQTLQMAWTGTVIGAVLALPLAVLAARSLSPPAVARPVRLLLAGVRTIPSLLWAIFFVVIVGLGPLAGILALAVYTTGFLGKLYYEALEGVDPELLDATRATGASRIQIARHAALPEAGNALVSQGLYAFEYNVRHSSLLGLVGAGGIGFYIARFVDRLEYQRLATTLVLIFVLVVAIDAASRRVRQRFLADARAV